MATTLFRSLTEKDKNEAIARLIEESTPRDDFFLMTILAVSMATLGLLLNSTAVIIGSMLIAPLLSPILSTSLGVVMADPRLIYRSFYTIGKAILWSVPTAAIISLLFHSQAGLTSELNPEILARLEPSMINMMVAIVAGIAASFAMIKPQINASLPGVAISVALIPPLAVTGIGLSRFDWAIMSDSFLLFLLNAIAIVFASLVVFSLMNMYVKRPLADKTVEKEDKKLEQEKAQAQHMSELQKTKTLS